MRASFNWLKDYVDIRYTPEVLAEKLTMAGLEVTSLTPIDQDTILEIEVTPNRTDCLSIIGIAREVAAIAGKQLKLPKACSFRGKSNLNILIQIQDKQLCPRYLGRVIKNVQVGPSPEWLVQRLEVMGIRSVNNIVDISNFCLLEFGQPLHAFDLDKLKGQRIIVRRAQAGEKLVTIDGIQRTLEPKMLIIADKNYPQALAGIMGGKDSEVSQTTSSIVLESAYFNPLNIHHTSRKLGLATQSSYRFERGVDLFGVEFASLRATGLIQKLAGAGKAKSKKKIVIGKLIDKGKQKAQPNKIRLRFGRLDKALGLQISPAQVKEILRKLQFTLVRKNEDSVTVCAPSFRSDISREADLIEEVARLYGYDKIPSCLPQLTPQLFSTDGRRLFAQDNYNYIRSTLATLGLHEIMSYSLISRQALEKLDWPLEQTIAVSNPLSEEQQVLRPELLTGMLNTMVTNINRKNNNLKLFELSRIYLKSQSQATDEFAHLCIAVAGKRGDNWLQKSAEYSFFDLKGILQVLLTQLGIKDFCFAVGGFPCFAPGRCSELFLEKESFGFLGELKPEVLARFDISCPVYAAELKLHKLISRISEEKKFIPLAKFPSIERDISLIAPQEVQSAQMVSLINKIGRELVDKVTLFDQYLGEQIPQDFRGLTYSIEYRSKQRTLTAEEVDAVHAQIRQALIEQLKVQIR